MELAVTYHGEPVGSVTITKCGLYYEIQAVCELHTAKPLRLYLISGLHSEPIGTLLRENGRYALSTRRSHRTFEPAQVNAAALGQTHSGGFRPWAGVLDDSPVTHAYLSEEAGLRLAVPKTDDFPLVGWLSDFAAAELDGVPMLVAHLNADGTPLRSEPTTTPPEQAGERTLQNSAAPFSQADADTMTPEA